MTRSAHISPVSLTAHPITNHIHLFPTPPILQPTSSYLLNRLPIYQDTPRYLKMQVPTVAVLTSILAAVASAATTYETANYLSVCQQGDNLFCTGNTNVCRAGTTDTFDDTATKANEDACKGLSRGDSCTQTVACV